MKQRGEMADHALELHVIWFGGGFHMAVDVHFDGAVIPSRNCHGRIDSFGCVEDL